MGRKSSVFFELFLKIETAARELREKLRLKDRRVPNVLELLHVLSSLTGWTVEYVDAHPHSKKVLAWVDGDKKILFVLNKTKKKLEYGNDTERERIAHELGHLALGHKGLLYDMQSRSYSVHTTEEMEAALFVPMFLAPRDLSGSCKSTAELRGQFHLTASTARTWLKNLRKIELEEHQQQLNLHRDKPKQEIEKHQPYDFLSLVKNRPDDKNRTNLLAQFELFRGNGGGLEEWFTENISDLAVEAITNVENSPLSRERVNQLLVLAQEGDMSPGFFEFYFLSNPHPKFSCYNPTKHEDFDRRYFRATEIVSAKHLRWGLHRIYTDGLLYFGNIRESYKCLRTKSKAEIEAFMLNRLFDPAGMITRGKPFDLHHIPKADRYLIAERACKTYERAGASSDSLVRLMEEKYALMSASGSSTFSVEELVRGTAGSEAYPVDQLLFSLNEVLIHTVGNKSDVGKVLVPALNKFRSAREQALKNTKLYLSMVQDLDIYVATSMREPTDFVEMADFCDRVFSDPTLSNLKLRYFDPTLSGAGSHEDKGLIECLMVYCAKALVYNAGNKDSFGKAVEAAMALNRGKPVIFYCNVESMHGLYRDLHPLSRLINFETGVAIGAMVTSKPEVVVELISRLFRNEMEFELKKKQDSYFLLTEKLTGSTVRLQTSDAFLREVFWNNYPKTPPVRI